MIINKPKDHATRVRHVYKFRVEDFLEDPKNQEKIYIDETLK
jgi:hypothetical protein